MTTLKAENARLRRERSRMQLALLRMESYTRRWSEQFPPLDEVRPVLASLERFNATLSLSPPAPKRGMHDAACQLAWNVDGDCSCPKRGAKLSDAKINALLDEGLELGRAFAAMAKGKRGAKPKPTKRANETCPNCKEPFEHPYEHWHCAAASCSEFVCKPKRATKRSGK